MKKIDKLFIISVLLLTVSGFFIFSSASLGILTKSQNLFYSIALNQFVFGLCLGTLGLIFASYTPYKFWKKISFYTFIFSLILTTLVFIPGIGLKHGGATRWIGILGFSFQPAELLKIAYIFYLAAVLSKYKNKIADWKYGLLPFISITGLVGIILILQPDNDTFFMIFFTGICMFFAVGGRWKHIGVLFLIAVIGFGAIVAVRPYVLERVMTFINPQAKSLSSGYQIQQSLIAIGSGGITGKGFGQSTQKFGFLPEPVGDSIFAVASEEFGFIGSVMLILFFVFFALRGLKIASKTPDEFGRLVCLGIVILIVTGSFINIAAMLAIIPLSGTPLIFISHGGSALFLALCEVGIIFNISKSRKLT